MAHVAAATAFQTDKLILDEPEGEKLSSAIQRVLRHYNIPDVASETKDWIALIICCGSIYGPRIVSAWADKKAAADKAETAAHEMTVVNSGGAGGLP